MAVVRAGGAEVPSGTLPLRTLRSGAPAC